MSYEEKRPYGEMAKKLYNDVKGKVDTIGLEKLLGKDVNCESKSMDELKSKFTDDGYQMPSETKSGISRLEELGDIDNLFSALYLAQIGRMVADALAEGISDKEDKKFMKDLSGTYKRIEERVYNKMNEL